MAVTAVTVTDVCLRDGLQDEPGLVGVDDKLRLAAALADAGLRSIEVGSFVRPDLVPQMADTGEVFRRLPRAEGITRVALAPNQHGATAAVLAGADEVRLVLSASEGHSRSNTRRSRDDGIRAVADTVDHLQLEHPATTVTVAVATAFVCPFDGRVSPAELVHVVRPFAEAGVTAVHLADTIGQASPRQVTDSVVAVRDAFPSLKLGLHLHDTYGRALANAWAGLQQGVELFDAALGGIGGCPFAPGAAGNVATDDLVELLDSCGVESGISVTALDEATELLSAVLGRPLTTSTGTARCAARQRRSSQEAGAA